MIAIYLASPFRCDTDRNIEYAKRCMLDSIDRGEAPYAPHLQLPLILDDNDPEQRAQGMQIAKALMMRCELVAVYADYGISDGMLAEINDADGDPNLRVQIRKIGENPGAPRRRKTDGDK